MGVGSGSLARRPGRFAAATVSRASLAARDRTHERRRSCVPDLSIARPNLSAVERALQSLEEVQRQLLVSVNRIQARQAETEDRLERLTAALLEHIESDRKANRNAKRQ
jgi:hypothetical protein